MWPGFLAAQIVREYSLLLIFLCKIFPEKLDKARGGRRGILDSPFQSTPPARGATLLHLVLDFQGIRISIHAPREGGDGRRRHWRPAQAYFNPRPPRGGRPAIKACQAAHGLFQSTPPARGGDGVLCWAWLEEAYISIHAPREGGDDRPSIFCLPSRGISIHAPREGGDLVQRQTGHSEDVISIHAPREGGDYHRHTAG